MNWDGYDYLIYNGCFFVATLVRSTFGFGESLVGMPLLALYIPLEVAVPISVLVSITVASIVVAQDWEKIHLRSVGWLMLFTLIGLPLGLLLLIEGDEHIVKAGLGIIIIVFSIYSLLDRYQIRLSSDNKLLLFICGLFAGIFGGRMV